MNRVESAVCAPDHIRGNRFCDYLGVIALKSLTLDLKWRACFYLAPDSPFRAPQRGDYSVVSGRPNLPPRRLLAALPADEYERLVHSWRMSFDLGEVVYEFGGHLDYVYFRPAQ